MIGARMEIIIGKDHEKVVIRTGSQGQIEEMLHVGCGGTMHCFPQSPTTQVWTCSRCARRVKVPKSVVSGMQLKQQFIHLNTDAKHCA
jgi:hypothetical protein